MQYNESMVILSLVVALLLFIVSATRPVSVGLSKFEVRRREKAGLLSDLEVRRARYFADIIVLRRLKSAALLVLFVPCSIAAFGWVVGVLAGVVVALEYQTIARLKPVRSIADKLYPFYEQYILSFCEKARWFFVLFSSDDVSSTDGNFRGLASKEELLSIVKKSPDILSKFESQLLKSALKFEQVRVDEIMTPRSVIDSIDHSELLGPITLSDLHKTGHSRFPVTDGDVDHIVGVLYVRNLLTIDGSKNSKKVSQVMDKEVCFIREDQMLDEALAAFLKTQKLLFIVINEFRETVGILSLEDVMEALLGQKITDEFEQHSSLRAVAERNPRKNNSPVRARNV